MSLTSLPADFSWLRAAYRPSDQEVDTYAHLIANAEGYPAVESGSRLFDEAELQLWTWRNEARKRTSRARAQAKPATARATVTSERIHAKPSVAGRRRAA